MEYRQAKKPKIKSFSEYLNESKKEITICIAPQMHVPSSSYEGLFEATAKVAGKRGVYRIYPTIDESNSPIDHRSSVKYTRKMFPRYARSVMLDESSHSVHDFLVTAYDEGYTQVNLVVPENNRIETEVMVENKNGVPGRHGFYHFRGGVNVISSGASAPTPDKLVEAASRNDYRSFLKNIPADFSESKNLFNHVRRGVGLSETHDFRSHIQLSPVSERREEYVAGNLFKEGDEVVVKETDEVGTVMMLGSNYVLVETADGRKVRKWLDSVEKINESELSVLDPKLDRFFDRLFHKKKYQKGIKYYINQHGRKGDRQDLVKVARITNLDFWNLERILHDMINKGVLPKSMATREDLLDESEIQNADTTIAEEIETMLIAEEETEVDRVEREKREAEMELEREYQSKLDDARRRDEIDDEQERRREEDEAEAEADDDEEDDDDDDEQIGERKSFKNFVSNKQ